jgi:lipopolysaccharide transport system permease protein
VATPVERAPLIIRPSTGWRGLALGELWRQRELLFVFAWRNILVRYKQTAFGIAWAILQPFFLMIVFTLFFNRLGDASSNGIPYPIFSYAGLLPWTFFSTSVTQSALSLVSNQNLLRKIYFPRLIIPISTVVTSLVDFAVASTLLAGMMLYYGVYPEPLRLLALPALLLLAVATALGVGLWLSSLNVLYRDIQYVVPFMVQAWLFATPAVYVGKTFDEPWGTLLGLNPMQGVVAGFRWALLSSGSPPGPMLAVSAAVTAVILVSGTFFFRRLERTFADVV